MVAMINSSIMNAPVRFIHVPKVTILLQVTLPGGLVKQLTKRRETPTSVLINDFHQKLGTYLYYEILPYKINNSNYLKL